MRPESGWSFKVGWIVGCHSTGAVAIAIEGTTS
jgi:hypothetical protein